MSNNEKDYLCLSVVGHVDHGKTTFTAALTKAAAKFYSESGNKPRDISKIDNAPEEQTRGITIVASHVPIFFPNREVSVTDCPGHIDYINNMLGGSRRSNFIILVVGANDGVAPQTTQHINITSAQGIDKVFVVYNKMDMPESQELIEVVESEVEELLAENKMQMIGSLHISATKSLSDDNELLKIKDLLKLMEEISLESLDPNAIFRMAIEAVYNPKGQGTIVTGKVISGTSSKGDTVDIIGMGKNKLTGVITKIESFNREVSQAKPNMDIGVQIRGVNKENIDRGMIVITKNQGVPSDYFKVLLKVSQDRRTPFKAGFEPQCYITDLGVSVTCKVNELIGSAYAKAGDVVESVIKLFKPIVASKGDSIILRESKVNVAFGSIVEILKS